MKKESERELTIKKTDEQVVSIDYFSDVLLEI